MIPLGYKFGWIRDLSDSLDVLCGGLDLLNTSTWSCESLAVRGIAVSPKTIALPGSLLREVSDSEIEWSPAYPS